MTEWVYFIHPPRENFAETMTEAEEGDPVVAEGFARGELREFRVSLLRGRDDA